MVGHGRTGILRRCAVININSRSIRMSTLFVGRYSPRRRRLAALVRGRVVVVDRSCVSHNMVEVCRKYAAKVIFSRRK